MRLYRIYFRFGIIVFLFPIIINSCLENDPQENNGKEQLSSDTTITRMRNETRVDTFSFNINSSLPDFIFILSDEETKKGIFIYNSIDSKLIQNIPTVGLPYDRPPGYDFFFTKDFNFDGYKDIVLLLEHGATGNISYRVWLYNKSKNIFETNDFFDDIDSPILDERKKQITTYLEYGGFDEYYTRTYKLKNNKFILMYEVKHWRDYQGDNYLQMKDSSISYKDTIKLVSRKVVGP